MEETKHSEKPILTSNDLILNKNIKGILIDSLISTHEMFLNSFSKKLFDVNTINDYKMKIKVKDEYDHCLESDSIISNRYSDKLSFRKTKNETNQKDKDDISIDNIDSKKPIQLNQKESGFGMKRDNLEDLSIGERKKQKQDVKIDQNALAIIDEKTIEKNALLDKIPEKYRVKGGDEDKNQNLVVSLIKNQNHITFRKDKYVAPEWHAPWKLSKVLIGQHTGWVRCIDIDPTNQWFVTGSNDKVIKFWELSTGIVKVSLTGHINTVRGLAISKTMPYLFSCGEDKLVKCWDLEQNKVVRHYHGHLSGTYFIYT